MIILPESTNAQYRGSLSSAVFLGLVAILTIVPGCIHYFLPDGGAGVIAGIDLSVNRATIVGVFAWMGSTQIPYGAAQLLVAVRYRPLTPVFLLLELIGRILSAVAAWVTKGSLSGHHPPENYAILAAIPLLLMFLWLSLKPRAATEKRVEDSKDHR